MIIDLIIERKDNEALIAQGKTHEYLLGVRRDKLYDGVEVGQKKNSFYAKLKKSIKNAYLLLNKR